MLESVLVEELGGGATEYEFELAQERSYLARVKGRIEELCAEYEAILADDRPAEADQLDRRLAATRLAALSVDRPICIGRIDPDGEPPIYVGRVFVEDEADVLVVSWDAPAARPYYTAHQNDPMGLLRRRHFIFNDGELAKIMDEDFSGPPRLRAGRALLDSILADMDRRTGAKMSDIVDSIHQEQYEIIADRREGPLLVIGGPGTGKTAVALHRLAHAMFDHQTLEGPLPLVVGPNRGFLGFIRDVLPGLGHAVESKAVGELGFEVLPTGEDALEVARLKGDARLAEVMRRFLEQQVNDDGSEDTVRLPHGTLTVDGEVIRLAIRTVNSRGGPYSMRRNRFRTRVLDQLAARYRQEVARRRSAVGWDQRDVLRELSANPTISRRLERVWPSISPAALLRDVLTRPSLLSRAAEGVLRPDEQDLLIRPRSSRLEDEAWTVSDAALYDEAVALIHGTSAGHTHVLLDEAQDLTPMQLRAVARRSRGGWLTAAGDLAQSSGEWQHDSWEEVFSYLAPDVRVNRSRLSHTYRVPDFVMDIANEVLRAAAPDLATTMSVRHGVDRPEFVEVRYPQLLAASVGIAVGFDEGTTALIAPDSLVEPLLNELRESDVPCTSFMDEGINASGVTVVRSIDAKGLEFTNVVVVEPIAIVQERPLGLRVLYVAVTRAVKRLRIVYADPLPPSLVIAEQRIRTAATMSSDIGGEGQTYTVDQLVDDDCIAYIARALEVLPSRDLWLLYGVVKRFFDGSQENLE